MYQSASDYYPMLWGAISGLERNSVAERVAIYDHARRVLLKQMWTCIPPLPYEKIRQEKLTLEQAIRDIELRVLETEADSCGPLEKTFLPSRKLTNSSTGDASLGFADEH